MNARGAISSAAASTASFLRLPRRHVFSFSTRTQIPSPNCESRKRMGTISRAKPIRNNYSSSPISTAGGGVAEASPPSSPLEIEKPKKPWLIVGLGNPGKLYQGTRHNVGFEMVDVIAEAERISMSTVSFRALFGKGFIGDAPVLLAKPQTFMNASGESVGAIVSYFKIPHQQVLVIFDDMDLPFAKLRLLPKGGHGGQNGMRSVIAHMKGSKDFPRLRIGIGRPPGKMDPAKYVLRPFNKEERHELDFAFHRGLEAVRILVRDGFNKSATFINSTKSMEQLG